MRKRQRTHNDTYIKLTACRDRAKTIRGHLRKLPELMEEVNALMMANGAPILDIAETDALWFQVNRIMEIWEPISQRIVNVHSKWHNDGQE